MGTPDDTSPRLIVIAPDESAGQTFILSGDQVIIGHSDTADIVLDDRFVSRRHALVAIDASGQVTITDLKSTGGTYVNDARIEAPQALHAGDLVRFADMVARFDPGTPVSASYPSSSEETRIPPVPGRGGQDSPGSGDSGSGTPASEGGDVPGGGGDGPDGGGATYVVTGKVKSPTLPGIGGLSVQLVDKNIGGDRVLATNVTGTDGSYSFHRVISDSYLDERRKSRPDLQVKVLVSGTVLASSPVRYSAAEKVTLDVVLPASAPGLPTEYELLTANLAASYPGHLRELEETSGRQDITYLANKTGWDARAVAVAALADQFSQLTAPNPPLKAQSGQTAVWPVPTASVRPEFYYALFRAGVPANPDGLFRTPSSAVHAILSQAASQGVIPPALADEVPAAVQHFQVLSAAHLLRAAPPIGVSTLAEMLRPALPDESSQQEFARLYAQYQGDWTGFWPAVEQAFGQDATTRLQLTGQLYYLTINNEPLVSALMSQTDNPLTSLGDLASLGFYDPATWKPLIGGVVPAQIPGSNADEQVANYADLLAAHVRLAYPTAVAADQVRRSILPIVGTADVADSVAGFLTAQQAGFAVGVEPVEAYIARTGLTETPPDVVTAIKRIQRAYQLTPDDASMAVLLHHNLDSAYAITRYGSAGFTRAFAGELGGADKAGAVYARASQVFSATLGVTLAYLTGRTAPSLGGQSPVQYGFWPPPTPPDYPVTASATLEDLFGSLDFCACSDCGSILSPAAYLVDLLDYVDQPAPAAGLSNPQDVLFQRRPDLQYLALTCANTNTALPYIDIANELLEYLVSNDLQIAGYQGHNTSDTITSAELIASPQNVNDAAYGLLQRTFFPRPLPFNRPLMLLRAHLARLGVSLPAAMTTLRANDDLTATPPSYGWNDILIEQLSISRDEYRLFTDSTLQLGDLYGLPLTPAPPLLPPLPTLQMMNLQDFSRRTGVSYDDLVSIVSTQFVNPNASLIPKIEALNASFATLQQLYQTVNTPQSIAAEFIAALPADIDPTQYGTTDPTDYQAVVNWVTDPSNYQRIMSIITITNPSGSADDCSGTALQFRYSNTDNTANLLSGTDFLKIIRFIRIWQKLAPALGDLNDSTAIQRTDDILGALYPVAKLPIDSGNQANDASNRVLLDAGFAAMLPRAGFLFQVLASLGLVADDALDQLLACWAQIGTAGQNSLYASLFLSPALLLQDPGAQTATVADTINAGDVLHTLINGVEQIPPYDVQNGQGAASVAAAISQAINTSVAPDKPDPVSGLQLSSRFYASVNPGGGVITIMAGFTIQCSASSGAVASYALQPGTPVSQFAQVSGIAAAGDQLITTIDGVQITYQAGAGDTPAMTAAGIADAVNATTLPDPYSGLPLNSLVMASASAGGGITFTAVNSGAPFSLECWLAPGNAGTYVVTSTVPSHSTATIAGTVAPGDILVTTINGTAVTYTAGPGDTSAAALAASIATAVGSATDATTGLPLSGEFQATSTGDVITISAVDPSTPLTLGCSVTSGSETYTQAGPFPETATAPVAGTIPAGTVFTTTVNALPVLYQAVTGDTPATIASAIAAAINATTTGDPVTFLPLNQVVTASSAPDGTVTLTAASATTAFTLTASISAGGYTAGQHVPPFGDNGYGEYLVDPNQTLFGHEPTICAACNLTSAEFALIATALGFDASTALSLDTVSQVFRFGWLAHALALSVKEFMLLRQWTGLDPFASLDPGTSPPAEPAIVRFIRLLGAVQNAGLTTSQALYLLWNADITGTSVPPLATITALATALRTAFDAADAQFSLQVDPDGSIAQGLMTLVYGTAATTTFFGLLNGTFTTSVGYSTPPGYTALPQQIIDASDGRLSYDNLAKQLTFGGVLDGTTKNAIDAAITASAPDVAQLTGAVANLAAANQQSTGPFFASYPELLPLYTAFVASSDPAQTKRSTLLASFLPILKTKRKQEQAIAAITSAAAVDPSFAPALLQDPTILHADADVTLPAVTDLAAIENQGLSAQFFLGNNLAASPDQVVDSVAALSYYQTATISGPITTGDVMTTTINGVPIAYTVGSAAAAVPPAGPADTTPSGLAGNVAAAINAATAINQQVTASVLAPQDGNSSGPGVIVISGTDPSGKNAVFALTTGVSGGATESYLTGSELPPGNGGGDIAAIWSGYLTVPQDGLYDFDIATDAGASVSLRLNGVVVPIGQSGSLWSNSGPISLRAGTLMPIVLTASSIKTTFTVSWQTQGTGWQPVPAQYLYPANLVDHLGNTYVRFLKATSLASALSLTAAEIAWLGTAASYSVNTTCGSPITPGPETFRPAAMTNISAGSVLVIDDGDRQETVTVTAVSPATGNPVTFSAVAAKAHDGSAPFPILSASFPEIGRGWLNFLVSAGWLGDQPAMPGPDPATAASLYSVLQALCDFARIKRALSPADSRLLTALKDPAAQLPVSQAAGPNVAASLPLTDSALLSLTGWDRNSVIALLLRFFGSANPEVLSEVANFSRVYDAYSLVTKTGLSAPVLLAAITNTPTPTVVSAMQSALRAKYAPANWLTVVGPINDQARISQRDALVAYVLQQLGDRYAGLTLPTTAAAGTAATQLSFAQASDLSAGMAVQAPSIAPGTTVTTVSPPAGGQIQVTLSTAILSSIPAGSDITFRPTDVPPIETADSLYQYYLLDTQMQPAVLTSRILLALSAVQLFAERILRNLEPSVSPADIDPEQWTWMKRYRVWQANREVFLWPENWLYPELRDEQSPFFKQIMGALLQGDITDDAAASAYLDYLSSLEEVAKLEPCGLYYVPGTASADETSYVVARTAGAHRKYYFRELTGGSWTPWAQVQIDCEDMPITPIVWNRRLFLFWLKITKQIDTPSTNLTTSASTQDVASMQVSDVNSYIGSSSTGATTVTAQAVLCWTEYYNGQWQPTKTSDANRPTTIQSFDATGSNSLESCRNLTTLVPAQFTGSSPVAASYSVSGQQLALPPDALMLSIMVEGVPSSGGFILHNTHSLPVIFDDVAMLGIVEETYDQPPPLPPITIQIPVYLPLGAVLDVPGLSRSFAPQIQPPYQGGYSPGNFGISYANTTGYTPPAEPDLFGYAWQPRIVDTQPWLVDPWRAPFFYEDRRHAFYVVPTEQWSLLWQVGSFGIYSASAGMAATGAAVDNLVLSQTVVPPTSPLAQAASAAAGVPAAMRRYLTSATDLRAALPIQQPVVYQGRLMTPVGSLTQIAPTTRTPRQS